jgi:hypothetical protein
MGPGDEQEEEEEEMIGKEEKRKRERRRREKGGERKPQRTLTNCHLQCNTRSIRTIIQRDAAWHHECPGKMLVQSGNVEALTKLDGINVRFDFNAQAEGYLHKNMYLMAECFVTILIR